MAKRKKAAAKTRAYEGASPRDGWRPRRAGASANTDHRADATPLRVRARALVQNVPYIARGLQALVSNVIGTGISPRSLAPRKRDARALDQAWQAWAPLADADGLFDVYGLQAAAYRAMEQDGEVLIRRRTRRPEDGLAVPLQLQLLEIDWLDTAKQGTSPGGGSIVNGIEYDVLGRVRAYWLHDSHPGDQFAAKRSTSSRPVSADDIIHLFAPGRPGQGRGISRFACVIARARDLMLYEDAELQRKNLEARLSVLASGDVTGMANPRDYAPGPGGGAEGTAAADPAAARIDGDLGQLPSGGILELPPGLNLTAFDPKPGTAMVDYCKWQLHMIAAGIGVPYEALTGDMREVNFSSARVRLIDFRRDCEQMQWLVLIPRMLSRMWEWFVTAAQLAGVVRTVDARVDWSTPRWDYVNPEQDVKADLEAIGGGLLSPSEALRRRGYKPDEVFAEIGRDFEALQASGALQFMQFMRNGVASAAPPAAPAVPVPADDLADRRRSASAELPALHVHFPAQAAPVVNVTNDVRAAEPVPPPVVNVTIEPTTVNVPAAEVRVDVQPTPVHVDAPNVAVNVEAPIVNTEVRTDAPVVNVTPRLVAELPARKTVTDIARDSKGNIVGTTQYETDL